MNLLNKSKLVTVFMGGFLCGVTYLISCGKVNTNEAGATGGTTRYVKANGTSLGEFLSLNFDTQSSTNNFVVLTSTGYLLVVEQDGQVIDGHIYYESANCSGTGYLSYMIANKSIFRNGSNLHYIAADATALSGLNYQSMRNAATGICEVASGTGRNGLPVTANNSTITGVSQTSFTPPITIE